MSVVFLVLIAAQQATGRVVEELIQDPSLPALHGRQLQEGSSGCTPAVNPAAIAIPSALGPLLVLFGIWISLRYLKPYRKARKKKKFVQKISDESLRHSSRVQLSALPASQPPNRSSFETRPELVHNFSLTGVTVQEGQPYTGNRTTSQPWSGIDVTRQQLLASAQTVAVSSNPEVDCLEFLTQLGEGTYGRVYKASWKGIIVAVKVMVLAGSEKREKMAVMEAAISSSLSHPNIVQTYTFSARTLTDPINCPRVASRTEAAVMGQPLTHPGTIGCRAATLTGSFTRARRNYSGHGSWARNLTDGTAHITSNIIRQPHSSVVMLRNDDGLQDGHGVSESHLAVNIPTMPTSQPVTGIQSVNASPANTAPDVRQLIDYAVTNSALDVGLVSTLLPHPSLANTLGRPNKRSFEKETKEGPLLATVPPDSLRTSFPFRNDSACVPVVVPYPVGAAAHDFQDPAGGFAGDATTLLGPISVKDLQQVVPAAGTGNHVSEPITKSDLQQQNRMTGIPMASNLLQGSGIHEHVLQQPHSGTVVWADLQGPMVASAVPSTPNIVNGQFSPPTDTHNAHGLQGVASTGDTNDIIGRWEVLLVQEYCEAGSLRDLLDKGGFRLPGGNVDMHALLETAMDIARAMEHLHAKHIVHSDLKPRNVLLKAYPLTRRGFIAKVADFGLSVRLHSDHSHVKQVFQGTLSHMAPEVLLNGQIGKPADVFAMGTVLWELYTGQRPFRGMTKSVLIEAITKHGMRPTFPPDAPVHYVMLAQQCWSLSPTARPTFTEILQSLLDMVNTLGPEDPGAIAFQHHSNNKLAQARRVGRLGGAHARRTSCPTFPAGMRGRHVVFRNPMEDSQPLCISATRLPKLKDLRLPTTNTVADVIVPSDKQDVVNDNADKENDCMVSRNPSEIVVDALIGSGSSLTTPGAAKAHGEGSYQSSYSQHYSCHSRTPPNHSGEHTHVDVPLFEPNVSSNGLAAVAEMAARMGDAQDLLSDTAQAPHSNPSSMQSVRSSGKSSPHAHSAARAQTMSLAGWGNASSQPSGGMNMGGPQRGAGHRFNHIHVAYLSLVPEHGSGTSQGGHSSIGGQHTPLTVLADEIGEDLSLQTDMLMIVPPPVGASAQDMRRSMPLQGIPREGWHRLSVGGAADLQHLTGDPLRKEAYSGSFVMHTSRPFTMPCFASHAGGQGLPEMLHRGIGSNALSSQPLVRPCSDGGPRQAWHEQHDELGVSQHSSTENLEGILYTGFAGVVPASVGYHALVASGLEMDNASQAEVPQSTGNEFQRARRWASSNAASQYLEQSSSSSSVVAVHDLTDSSVLHH